MTEQRQFLETLWPGGLLPGHRLLIWTLQDKRSHWFADLESAISHAEGINRATDAYVGCGTTRMTLGATQRATSAQVAAIPGLWADIDFGAGKKRRPADAEAAWKFAVAITGQPPSLTVHSGHGLQAWWLFSEPVEIGPGDAERVKAFGEAVIARGKTFNYDIDSVWDLSRIMRIPGTVNNKAEPVPVRLYDDPVRQSRTTTDTGGRTGNTN